MESTIVQNDHPSLDSVKDDAKEESENNAENTGYS